MDLTHRFTVPAPIEEAWAAFNDLERVAPCFPGAALTSYDGEEFAGLVKVKLGPISLQYTGTGRFVERDESAYRAVIEAKGKDKRGNGTAAASVTAQLVRGDGDATDVEVVTALNITGKPAQFGRGVMQDVSDKLLGQFAACLETKLGPAPAKPEPGPGHDEPSAAGSGVTDPVPDADPPSEPAGSEIPPMDVPPMKTPLAQPIASGGGLETASLSDAVAEPALDLGTTVLPILARRFAPYLVGGAVVLVVVLRLARRPR